MALRSDRLHAYEYLATDDNTGTAPSTLSAISPGPGRHRAVGIADLLTAALAGEQWVTLVHYDADFDIAGEVVTFDGRWVAPRWQPPVDDGPQAAPAGATAAANRFVRPAPGSNYGQRSVRAVMESDRLTS